LIVEPFPRPEWSPLPFEGCVGVEGKVLVRSDDFFLAMLHFEPGAPSTNIPMLERIS
jgi:hypothetical protein